MTAGNPCEHSPCAPTATSRAARWSWLVPAAGLALFLGWGIGQVYRDRHLLLALCFYVPSPFVTLALLAAAAWLWRLRRRRLGSLLAALAAPPLLMVALVENQWRRPPVPVPNRSLRLVHWNVMRGRLDWERQLDLLTADSPDLVVLSEPPHPTNPEALFARLGNGWEGHRLRHLVVGARGRLDLVKTLEKDLTLDAQLLRWHSPMGPVTVLAVDVVSTPWIWRDPILRRIVELTAQYQPDLVVGDFNAPRRSRALTELPSGYAHGYHLAGRGWSYTWIVPAPMFAIDQCLASSRANVWRYQLKGSWVSDHRRQLVDFSPSPPAVAEAPQP